MYDELPRGMTCGEMTAALELRMLLRQKMTPDQCLPRIGAGSTCPKKREKKRQKNVDQATKLGRRSHQSGKEG